jgi:predicted dinucleotide-binding enzyme
MRVGVIGSGRIGGNAGMQLARAGHEIMFSFTRDRAALDEFAAGVHGASAGSRSEAAEFADAVILAVPWSLVERAVEEAGGLARKTVIDTTNQYGGGGLESLPEGLTAAEVNARRIPHARLARAFNTLTSTYQRDVAEGLDRGSGGDVLRERRRCRG